METFKENDYRKILQRRLSSLKNKNGQRFTLIEMSKHCQIQSSYLSKVLKQKSHLNEDQIYLVIEYLGFTDDEKEYINLLHSYQRSSLSIRKTKLNLVIKTFRDKCLKTENQLKSEIIKEDSKENLEYFLDPQIQIIHLFLCLPKFQKDYKLILDFLKIS